MAEAPDPAGLLVVPAALPPVELVAEPLEAPLVEESLLGEVLDVLGEVVEDDEEPVLGEVLGAALEDEDALPLGEVLGVLLEDEDEPLLGEVGGVLDEDELLLGLLGVVVDELLLLGLLGVVVELAEPDRLVVSEDDDDPEVAPGPLGPRSQP